MSTEIEDVLTMTGCRDRQDLEDMARCGKSLLEAIAAVAKSPGDFHNWTPADDPAEIVTDLFDAYDETLSDWQDVSKALDIVRQSLTDQAAARLDPDMPRLTPEALSDLRAQAEGAYAGAETRRERVAAHGLSLLCAWQARVCTVAAAPREAMLAPPESGRLGRALAALRQAQQLAAEGIGGDRFSAAAEALFEGIHRATVYGQLASDEVTNESAEARV